MTRKGPSVVALEQLRFLFGQGSMW